MGTLIGGFARRHFLMATAVSSTAASRFPTTGLHSSATTTSIGGMSISMSSKLIWRTLGESGVVESLLHGLWNGCRPARVGMIEYHARIHLTALSSMQASKPPPATR